MPIAAASASRNLRRFMASTPPAPACGRTPGESSRRTVLLHVAEGAQPLEIALDARVVGRRRLLPRDPGLPPGAVEARLSPPQVRARPGTRGVVARVPARG